MANRGNNIRRKPYIPGRPTITTPTKKKTPLIISILLIFLIVAAVLSGKYFSDRGYFQKEDNALNSTDPLLEYGTSEIIGEDGNPIQEPEDSAENYDSEVYAAERDITNAELQTEGNLIIVGDSAYRAYTFSEESSQNYIDLLTDFQSSLGNSVSFANMVIPTSTDIMLPQTYLANLKTSDQQKALDYMYVSLSITAPDIKIISIFDILKANCSKDIYFKTDRNWTSLGAYYAYRKFLASKNVVPLLPSEFDENFTDGFLGSLYTQSNYIEALNKPETIVSYQPVEKCALYMYYGSSELQRFPLIWNVIDYVSTQKYSTFLGGDSAYGEIVNESITDGSSILVIKDSYGSSFVPLLAAHYQTIYVVDYRYYERSVSNLIKENGIGEILMLNHIESTSDPDAINWFKTVLSVEGDGSGEE